MGFGAFMKGFQGGHEWAEAAGERRRQRDMRQATGDAWKNAQVEQAIPSEQSITLEEQNKAFADPETGALPIEQQGVAESARRTIKATDWDEFDANLAETLLANGELDAYEKASALGAEMRRRRAEGTFKGAMMAYKAGDREKMKARMNELGMYAPGMEQFEFDIGEDLEKVRVRGSDGEWHDVDDDWMMSAYKLMQSPKEWLAWDKAMREERVGKQTEGAVVDTALAERDTAVAKGGQAAAQEKARTSAMQSESKIAGAKAGVAEELADLSIDTAKSDLSTATVQRNLMRSQMDTEVAKQAKLKIESILAKKGDLKDSDMRARTAAVRDLQQHYQTMMKEFGVNGNNAGAIQDLAEATGLDPRLVESMVTGKNALSVGAIASQLAMQAPVGGNIVEDALIMAMQAIRLREMGQAVTPGFDDETGEWVFQVGDSILGRDEIVQLLRFHETESAPGQALPIGTR